MNVIVILFEFRENAVVNHLGAREDKDTKDPSDQEDEIHVARTKSALLRPFDPVGFSTCVGTFERGAHVTPGQEREQNQRINDDPLTGIAGHCGIGLVGRVRRRRDGPVIRKHVPIYAVLQKESDHTDGNEHGHDGQIGPNHDGRDNGIDVATVEIKLLRYILAHVTCLALRRWFLLVTRTTSPPDVHGQDDEESAGDAVDIDDSITERLDDQEETAYAHQREKSDVRVPLLDTPENHKWNQSEEHNPPDAAVADVRSKSIGTGTGIVAFPENV